MNDISSLSVHEITTSYFLTLNKPFIIFMKFRTLLASTLVAACASGASAVSPLPLSATAPLQQTSNRAIADVKVSVAKSYLKVGETTTLTASSPVTWELPAGLELAGGQLTDQTITVKAISNGRQRVGYSADGESASAVLLDVLSDYDYSQVRNVMLGAAINQQSGDPASPAEGPANIVDGIRYPESLSGKWCSLQNSAWVVFDLGQVYRFYNFSIFDCKSGPEDDANFSDYDIYVAVPGGAWNLVVNETGRENDNIKTDNIAPAVGQLVWFNPKNTTTLRIWEFEAMGIPESSITAEPSQESITMAGGSSMEMTVAYEFNEGYSQDPSIFYCSGSSSNDVVSLGQILWNPDIKTFFVPLSAADYAGTATVNIRIQNGNNIWSRDIPVTVTSDNEAHSTPVAISDWKHDVIAEALPSKDHTNFTLDDQGWVLYPAAIQERGALSGEDLKVVSAAGTPFELAPFNANNSLVMKEANIDNTLTLATPCKASKLHLLMISAGGISTIEAKVNYTDGTSSDAVIHTVADWFGNASDAAKTGLGRMTTDAFEGFGASEIQDNYNFQLFERTIPADAEKMVKSVTLKSTDPGKYPAVLAVTSTEIKKGAGIEDLEASEATAPAIEAIYNLQGVRVGANPAPGLYIIRYSDGTSAKVMLR